MKSQESTSPSVSIQVHLFSIVEIVEVRRNFSLLQLVVVDIGESFDELNTWIVTAADESCFSSCQIQLLNGSISE